MRALGVTASALPGERRCFFCADSDMVAGGVVVDSQLQLVDDALGDALSGTRLPGSRLTVNGLAQPISITLLLELFLLHRPLLRQHTKYDQTMSDSDSEGGVPLIEAEFDTTASSKKRKREAEPEATKESKKAAKKQKRKEKKKQKAKEIDEDDLDQELGVNHSFERMDGQLVADYVNARTRLYGKELSSVELEDKFIPGMLAFSKNIDVF